jgi:hypothetical protein
VADTVGVAAERRGVRGDVGGARGAVKGEAQQWKRRWDAPRGGCAALADTRSQRPQGLIRAGAAARSAGRGDGKRAGRGAAEPGVGRGADGLSRGLDWPAGRGEPQHPWEPPRTTAERGAPGVRARRLSALGNAVVPQVARAVGAMVVEVLRSGGAA